jgi:hypothetical protein
MEADTIQAVPRVVTVLRKGDTFGEFSLFGASLCMHASRSPAPTGPAGERRSASVVCITYCSLFIIERELLMRSAGGGRLHY